MGIVRQSLSEVEDSDFFMQDIMAVESEVENEESKDQPPSETQSRKSVSLPKKGTKKSKLTRKVERIEDDRADLKTGGKQF